MLLKELIEIYGFTGKQKTCAHPDEICWYATLPTISDVIKLITSNIGSNETLEDLMRIDNLYNVRTIYIPVAVRNPIEATKYNHDLIHFDIEYVGKVGRYLNASHPALIVFARNSKDEFEDANMFRSFQECCDKCDEWNNPLYKEDNLKIITSVMESYCSAFKLWRNRIGGQDGYNQIR